jgi:selenocysteine-specific elongation factor
MTSPRHLVVGTAGHIDHGKSSLVLALTGIDPDRLIEEKRRGITIDLGFANLALDDGRLLSFVDVPGHERFVRHMVAGATGIDAVALVVAADAGVEPQTREHLAICRLLGVRDGVVVLTKRDLVDDDLCAVAAAEVEELLAGTFLEGIEPIAVSTRSGAGLPELRCALARLFDRLSARPKDGVPRLPIDRSFVLRGFGTVVTGTVASGRFAEGDEVEILPGRNRARLRGIEGHGQRLPVAAAGQRAALNLHGVDCAEAARGTTVTIPGALDTTRRIWATVDLLDTAPESLALRGGRARFHQGTCERDCRFRLLERSREGSLRAVIHLAEETVLAPGDRFILRRPAPVDTVGGGTVVDVRPPRARRAVESVFAAEAGGAAGRLIERIARAGPRGRDEVDLAPELGLARGELLAVSRALETEGTLVRLGARWFSGASIGDLERRTLETLARLHAADRLRAGIPREELRAAVERELPQDAWRIVVDRLAARALVRAEGDKVALAAHEVVLSPDEERLARRIEGEYERAGLDPPDWDALVLDEDRGRARRIADWLVGRGTLVRIPDGRLVHAAGIGGLVERLRAYGSRSRTIDVAGFKDLAGVTRKNAIPLLEYLDSVRITRRHGNLREIL